jgi:hypothetical protein
MYLPAPITLTRVSSHICVLFCSFFTIAILRASLFNIIGLVRSAPTALQFANAVVDTGGNFATGVVNKVVLLDLQISPANF